MTDRPTDRRLTQKQRLFVEAYVGEARGNATEAARLAGYKGRDTTLAQVGAENLRKPYIASAIEKRAEEMREASGALTPEEIHELWGDIARDTQQSTKDRLKASELAAKSQGMFLERLEVDVSGQVDVVAYIPSNGREHGEEE